MNFQHNRPWDGNILPHFCIVDDYLFCDHRFIDLKRRPLTKRLIKTFLDAEQSFLDRDYLVRKVYGGFDPGTKSKRFQDALRQNVTKMISRARFLCEEHLNEPGSTRVEMFVHIPERGGWTLFRLSNTYLAGVEETIRQWHASLPHAAEQKSGARSHPNHFGREKDQSIAA